MQIKDLSEFKRDYADALVQRIPFFKEIQRQDDFQLSQLLVHCCVVELEPAEVIMRRGDRGSWLYFLVKGELDVFLNQVSAEPLSNITPGEVFGDLALLCGQERKATVAAGARAKSVLLLAMDFRPFADIQDFSRVNLATKLAFYRMILQSIRWRLELKRMTAPNHALALAMREAKLYHGEKNTVAELQSLHQQAVTLAAVLDRWNNESPSADMPALA
jgi:CRP-like cAMP-binding protein